ncbi:hypothetical protein CDL12_10223 [Handroanthus impetiginosus]|uniref:Retrotransposon gag domain-containing protein n=1 Tax=Handroanthus impetiginosus TaxID=429701 RepID=A0A2G9HHW7_9LAMI|nr:hypothetical protein CDL12_10223 [Handroanthus impetiginosus]
MDIAKSMWEDLRDLFSQGIGPRIYELKTHEVELRQEGLIVAAYYTKLKGIWDELGNYSKLSNSTCGLGQEFLKEREDLRTYYFFIGLNSSMYGTIRSQILSIYLLLSLSIVYAMVAQEERHEMQQLFCSHCNKSGHDVSQCYKIIGYPVDWGQRRKGTDHGKRQNEGPNIKRSHSAHHAAHQGGGVSGSSSSNGANIIGPGTNSIVSVPVLTLEHITALLSLLETSKRGAKTLSGPHFEESDLKWVSF